jgi:hypothetical protein
VDPTDIPRQGDIADRDVWATPRSPREVGPARHRPCESVGLGVQVRAAIRASPGSSAAASAGGLRAARVRMGRGTRQAQGQWEGDSWEARWLVLVGDKVWRRGARVSAEA